MVVGSGRKPGTIPPLRAVRFALPHGIHTFGHVPWYVIFPTTFIVV